MIEKNIRKRYIRKAQFIKTKLYSINLFPKKKSEYSKALCKPGPESTLRKTFLRFSLVKLVQTRLDKKSHGLKKPAGNLKPKDMREMKGSTTN